MPKTDLHTLIRIHKFALDEKQRKLGELLRYEQALLNRKDLLLRRYKEEEKIANENQIAAMTFGAYIEWYLKEKEMVEQAIEEVRQNILIVRDEIIEAYQELKTFQISQDNRDAKDKAELEHKMVQILDEIGLTLYRRRNEQNNPQES